MNKIINKLFLAGDKLMPELHLDLPKRFTYSACGSFTKNKGKIQKLKKARDSRLLSTWYCLWRF